VTARYIAGLPIRSTAGHDARETGYRVVPAFRALHLHHYQPTYDLRHADTPTLSLGKKERTLISLEADLGTVHRAFLHHGSDIDVSDRLGKFNGSSPAP
jgi:hypothetical protein